MKGLSSKVRGLDLDWRRRKVLELTYEGRNERTIADTLRFSLATIERDIRYWKKHLDANDFLDKNLLWECEKGVITYDAVNSYMWDIVKDTTIDVKARVGAANAITNATDKKLDLLRAKDTLRRTVKIITTLKQRTADLPQGSTPQNTKQTIVTEQETLTTRGPNN